LSKAGKPYVFNFEDLFLGSQNGGGSPEAEEAWQAWLADH
jgi:hypothetical protein